MVASMNLSTLVHVIFSTSCDQHHRQLLSAALQVSATRVNHVGPITELTSGCTPEQIDTIRAEPKFYDDFHHHFTPAFSPHPYPDINDAYTAYNKPFSMQHFLYHAVPPVGLGENMPVALVDADFVFLKPLRVNTGANMSAYYGGSLRDAATITDTVADGSALAQDWSIYYGGGWFNDDVKARKEAVCAGQPCINVTQQEGKEYYSSVGPPYIMTRNDALKFVGDYCNFTVRARQVVDDWMVEMYAYGLAAANHGIKHTPLSNLGPSMPRGQQQSWNFLPEEMENPCSSGSLEVWIPDGAPVMIHYCQSFALAENDQDGYHFFKYQLPLNILACDSMLLALPPPSQWTEIDAMGLEGWPLQSKRHEIWAECTLAKLMNQNLITIKEKLCPRGFNSHRGLPMNERVARASAFAQISS
ncbi:hypothetical protein LEN26_012632 [Aphanomyces euteiches]|nr:hypothetical protein LEN26_012632 [Aphanomyces euteiches]KAH9127303.1 hypothetical protein AeMF1_002376 [Aphanomyces euteiches]KAH9183750.1 hypothetical protein AeNC1_014273 [Aphanomyces euteiches]